ncbi:PREDICTED: polycomb group protein VERNALIZATION 2-like isoform X1 [Camelina sativa]|uniref:Polycomb group protein VERNALIZATION 2-like isoform X1 n=1 Tax=Camelina sativa TaxID=90675 RepID=A0ABM0V268_CAMSA|nr:PREDICTED: polycomb group protein VERNALIZATION 2-like isoform X1 [Camelina sativa]
MCRQNCRAKSSPEEVISTDENLLIYCKPVRLYNIFHLRSLCNPSFLPRCLNYKIGAKRKRKSRSTGMVVFNYKDCNNTLQKTEVREDCSCPFCFMLCGSFKGLQFHLNSSHDLFEFEFKLSEEYQTVNVSVKLDSFIFDEEEGSDDDKFEPFSLCSKPRKRRQRGGKNNTRRLKVQFLPLDSPSLANGTENGLALLNDGNRGLGYPEATGLFEMTRNTPPAIAHSSLGADAKVVLTSEAVVHATKTKKLSAERSEARSHLLLQKRQFYHSHRVQPMMLEQVMSDRDSEDEVDDFTADIEDRQLQMLDDFVDVNKDEKQFMHLWNTFVRKQRVIADGHISWACEAFSRFYEKELHSYSSLFWCWKLFLIKLWNHGLVDSATINNCSSILENCHNSSDTNNNTSVDHPNDISNKNTDGMDVVNNDNDTRDN